MMDLNEPSDDHGEQLFGADDGTTVNITPNFSLSLSAQTATTSHSLTEDGFSVVGAPQLVNSTFTSSMVENYANMSSEYLKRRYKRRHENPEKIRELMNESLSVVENLRTAVEGKMDAAAIGVLQSIIAAIEAGSGAYAPSPNGAVPFAVVSKEKETAYVEDAGDRQRALFKANVCPIVTNLLRELGGHPVVCEKALWCIAYLCRYSEEYKSSVCLENAKGFGVCGISDIIISAVKKHHSSKTVLSAACDAIRCLCALESNRDRLGHAGACETMARALMKYMNNPEVISWICRAIGHLANNHASNLEMLGSNGGCENIILALQKYPTNLQVCIECCYAIRNMSVSHGNKTRLIRDFAPESILAVFKHHFSSDAFSIEACHAIVNMIGSESDELINRVANGGYINYAMRALKKNPDNDVLARWVYQGLYYMACDDRLLSKLVTSEILDTLSMSLENHAGEENMAEWGCRFIEKILAQSSPHTIEMSVTAKEGESGAPEAGVKKGKDGNVKVVTKGSQALFLATCAKLRTAGMCEMITSAVQRQAISAVVASIGALCIGQLARDHHNQSRLSSAGACEAVVTALKRHSTFADVCTNTCYSIYYLCKSVNNISWMGAYGACEGVCNALKIFSADPNVVRYASLAVAALAYKDEGNLERLQKSDVNNILVSACSIHVGNNCFIAENMCHAISNLCLEVSNVNNLGKCGACGLAVDILFQYASMHSVVTQALIAIAALAVKQKTDKVHKGNTRKLVEKGVLEVTIAVMQKFIEYDDVQRAGGLALAALARLEPNKLQLAKNSACELIMQAVQLHAGNPLVVVKLVFAIEALTQNCDSNVHKFSTLHAIEVLLRVLVDHENVHYVVESVYRALINMCLMDMNNFVSVFNEASCKQIVKTLKLHEKHSKVAKWGCHLIYTGTVPAFMRSFGTSTNAGSEKLDERERLKELAKAADKATSTVIPQSCIVEARKQFGLTKSPETLVSVLTRYVSAGEERSESKKESKDSSGMNNMHALHAFQITVPVEVLIFACMAIYSVALFEPNKAKFIGHDVSVGLVKTLLAHYKESILCEWVLIDMNVLLLTNHQEKMRLGQQGIMKCVFNIATTYSTVPHDNNINIVRLVCDSIYELCLVPYNQQEFAAAKEGSRPVVELMMSLIGIYADNLDLIIAIFKALSSVCINNSTTTTKSKGSTIFGSPSHGAGSASSSEHVLANSFLDAGLSDRLLQALTQHSNSPALVQWVCATMVSLCTKNPRAQTLFASQMQMVSRLTPLMIQHKQALSCVTQIARALRSLVVNIPEHNGLIARSSVILPTLLELLELHIGSDGLVEHACFLLGNIEYKPSAGHWTKVSSNLRSIKSGITAASAEALDEPAPVTPTKSSTPDGVDLLSPAAFVPGTPAHDELSPTASRPADRAFVSAKAFYGGVAHYDLLFSVLQTHLAKNKGLNGALISGGTAPPPAKSYNNNNVIRMICMAVSMFAEKGKLHHYNLCSLLFNLISKEATLNSNDENLIQKVLVCVGTLCKANEQNNSLLCVSLGLVEELALYVHGFKESSVVLYGALFAVIGACEFNLAVNQAKVCASPELVADLVEVMYNDLETDFIAQFGCVIVSSIANGHLKNKLKCHNVCTYIADVLAAHRSNPQIVLEGLRTISSLSHACITNRNRLGTSDACKAVCDLLTVSVQGEELAGSASFMKFPQNALHWGTRSIGDLAANHANNCAKLGAAGACAILLQILRRPQQHAGEFAVEMKLHSEVYWALANLLLPTKEDGLAAPVSHSLPAAQSGKAAANLNANLMSTLNMAVAKPVKNSSRLLDLGVGEAVSSALAKALRYGDAAFNTAGPSDAAPLVTLMWGARLLVSLCKSQRIKQQLLDNGITDSVNAIVGLAQAAASTAKGTTHKDLQEWAQMAKAALV